MLKKEEIKAYLSEHEAEIKEKALKIGGYAMRISGMALIFVGGYKLGKNYEMYVVDSTLKTVNQYYPDAKISDIWNPDVYMKWVETLKTGVKPE